MNRAQPHIEARKRHRSAKHLRADGKAARCAASSANQIANEELIFRGREVAGRPDRNSRTPAPKGHAFKAASSAFECIERAVMPGHLNAFFAISVNSPSMSMVNFSCCVGSAQKFCARGVTRRVTPQPTRAALRMEAEAHVCV
jgi:hypothetical protein